MLRLRGMYVLLVVLGLAVSGCSDMDSQPVTSESPREMMADYNGAPGSEMAMESGIGARTWIPDGVEAFTFLFSESAARAVVVVPRSEELRFTEMCGARRFPCERIGVVDSGLGEVLKFGDEFTVSIPEMKATSARVLPELFG